MLNKLLWLLRQFCGDLSYELFPSGSFAAHFGDHLWLGITCGPFSGSFPVGDHFRSGIIPGRGSFPVGDHFRSGIIPGRGSFPALYRSRRHVRRHLAVSALKKRISHRNTVMATKVPDFAKHIIVLYLQIFNTQNYILFKISASGLFLKISASIFL